MSQKRTLEELEPLFVLPDYQRKGLERAAWNGMIAVGGKETIVSARCDSTITGYINELQARIPGLTNSAAARLLMSVGVDSLRAIEHYAPAIIEDTTRRADGVNPSNDAARLASMVCPLVAHSVEYTSQYGL